mgnify:CR=1 FL=1
MKDIKFTQNGRFFYGWIVVFLGLILMTFAYVGFVSLTSVFVLPVTEDLGIDRGDWMSYMVVMSLACIVASPFLGKLMGKYSLKLWHQRCQRRVLPRIHAGLPHCRQACHRLHHRQAGHQSNHCHIHHHICRHFRYAVHHA